VVIDEDEVISFNNNPSQTAYLSLIVQISVQNTDDVTFDFIAQDMGSELIQDNLDRTGMGIYQLLLATFTHNTDGTISNVVRTADIITGVSLEEIEEVIDTKIFNAITSALEEDY
jgi:hypothetical protein